jgi:hypothetical protein
MTKGMAKKRGPWNHHISTSAKEGIPTLPSEFFALQGNLKFLVSQIFGTQFG